MAENIRFNEMQGDDVEQIHKLEEDDEAHQILETPHTNHENQFEKLEANSANTQTGKNRSCIGDLAKSINNFVTEFLPCRSNAFRLRAVLDLDFEAGGMVILAEHTDFNGYVPKVALQYLQRLPPATNTNFTYNVNTHEFHTFNYLGYGGFSTTFLSLSFSFA
ncbi:hypothetical protein TSUD_176320 [Trifolium subterraneum]|uniref:Longin domain-containing protein n=1 Tax=Trifolium subterraneum TaxID=3900 RepID=A0A2Z6NYM6_TRISU|nr:hypothetical protein TSUD_176320 [Trifolium subterraneum]